MREVIVKYASNIAFFIVFMNLILMLAPSEKYRGYIKAVLGFVLILVMVSPVQKLFAQKSGYKIDEAIEKYHTEIGKKEYEQGSLRQRELIERQFEKELLIQINSIIKNQGRNVNAAELSVEYIRENDVITAIASLNITITGDFDEENIKNTIADFYKLDKENINIIRQLS